MRRQRSVGHGVFRWTTPSLSRSEPRGPWADESAWSVFLRRPGSPFERFIFSADGQLIATVIGKATDDETNKKRRDANALVGTKIERVRDGSQVAFLPGLTEPIGIAPGNKMAVSSIEGQGIDRGLLLWDLDRSQIRARLLVTGTYQPRFEFSRDGQYVFANNGDLTWWETSTGHQIGHVANVSEIAIVDDGRTVVTCGSGLGFWNVASGAMIDEWGPWASIGEYGRVSAFKGGGDGHYLAAEFDPPLAWWETEIFARPAGDWQDVDRQIVIWDVAKRREFVRLPYRMGVLSDNGQWLATIDRGGVVRVWEVPTIVIKRPWPWVLGYSALVALAAWAVGKWLAKHVRATLAALDDDEDEGEPVPGS
jgi:WD40 repeat protein